MEENSLIINRPPNCGHDPVNLTLSRFFQGGYTEEHEHLLICPICELGNYVDRLISISPKIRLTNKEDE